MSRHRRRITLAWAAAHLAAATVLMLLTSGCAPGKRNGAPQGPDSLVNAFVGDGSCVECHAKEFDEHRATNHALTLRPADRKSLGDLAPLDLEKPSSELIVRREGERYTMARKGVAAAKRTLDYALGSGKTGLTFISVDGPDQITELRMSSFPKARKWYVTPGQEQDVDDAVGREHKGASARKCIQCHATTLAEGTVHAEPKFMGVGCESCHGPGKLHIEAAKRKGSTNLHMADLKTFGGNAVNDLCGKCHRTAADVPLFGADATSTHRFQPYGLSMSPCFKKSGDKMTCMTCHNPHTNASTDHRYYEAVCLACHTPAGAATPPVPKDVRVTPVFGGVCPVNAKEKCVGCHMPARKVLPFSDVPVKMADHLIRANRRTKTAAATKDRTP
jgi:hypothetical protein